MVLTSFWKPEEIEEFQDKDLRDDLAHFENTTNYNWQLISGVMEANPKVFPEKFVTRELFDFVYGNVCTRCFGYITESTCMIPFADNLNHSSSWYTEQHMVNTTLHLNSNPEYFSYPKMLCNYSSLFEEVT